MFYSNPVFLFYKNVYSVLRFQENRFVNMRKKYITFACFAILLATLIWSFVGCSNGTPRYDRRLIVADSVMHQHPDSALRMLTELDIHNLKHQADIAYYSLLLTQARYRCYVPATSDSTINVALDYYEKHKDENEKLTRAYIYKGAVMEELDEPERAMNYYKRAISSASMDDAFNQGYARFRIGNIYRNNLVADSADICLMKEALHYFKQVPDSFYILSSLIDIGSAYISENQDSAFHYLYQADALAKQLNEKGLEQSNLVHIADMKMFSPDKQDIRSAKEIALTLLNDSSCPQNKREHLLMVVALTSAELNMPDSASHYLNQVDQAGLSPHQLVFFNKCRAELARCRGDFDQYQYYFECSDHLSDSLVTNDLQRRLRDVETKYDNEALKYQALKYKTFWVTSLLLIALIVSVAAIVLMVIRKKLALRKRQLKESEDAIERMTNDTARLASQLKENQMMSEDLKQVIRNQIDVFTRLVDRHNTMFAHSPKKFSNLFEKSYNINQPDSSFWAGLRTYVDSTCGNIITQSLADCPMLSETDIRFLSLYCCDLPTTVIMVCMGYNEAHSVYNKKRRVTDTIGLEVTLDEYIEKFKPSILEADLEGDGGSGVESE